MSAENYETGLHVDFTKKLTEDDGRQGLQFTMETQKSIQIKMWRQHCGHRICSEHFKAIQNGLVAKEKWTLQLIDSWGKIPSGILWGNFRNLGNYDECIKVVSDEKIQNDYVKGKYCTMTLPIKKFIPELNSSNVIDLLNYRLRVPPEIFNIYKEYQNYNSTLKDSVELPDDINLQIGTCLPKICRHEYMSEVIKEFLKDKLNIELNDSDVIFNSRSCQKHSTDVQFETIDYVAITIFSIVAVLMVLSSVYDLIMQQLNRKPKILFTSFSIITNGRKLFAPAPSNSDNVIGCLNGIRCLSMFWVLLGHAYAFIPFLPLINMIDALQWQYSVFAQVIFNANICVDSFFFLSGFLVAWIGFKELNKSNGKLNVPLMYFHRYIRLTPVIAVAILFLLSLYKFLGDGPYWDFTTDIINLGCEQYWWSTLLYILNYTNPDQLCLMHTWYLAVDTQLFILSPLLLIPTYKWGRKFLYPTAIIVCTLSIACCFATHLLYKFPMVRVENTGEPDVYAAKIYYPTHTRVSPWIVGFVLGYFMFINKSKRFKISKIFNVTAWLLAILVCAIIVFGTYRRYQPGSVATPLEATFYESFKRISWSIALSWIVFSCQKGYGGIINSFLSHSFWGVFGRLTYCIYLYHIFIMSVNVGIMKTEIYFTDYNYQLLVWGHFGWTVFISVLATLAFELPILELEKAIFRNKKAK